MPVFQPYPSALLQIACRVQCENGSAPSKCLVPLGQKARGNLRTEVAFGRRCCNGLGECAQAVRARVEQRYKIWAPHVLLSAGSQTLWPLIVAAIDPLWLSLVSSNRGSQDWAVPGYRVVAANLNLVCSRCRTPASLLCACRRIRYCSRACQRKHWKTHRTDCCASLRRTTQILLTAQCLRVPSTALAESTHVSIWRGYRTCSSSAGGVSCDSLK